MTLSGKRVLITGAAGAKTAMPGIGAALTRTFHAHDAHVIAVDIDGQALAALAGDLPGIQTVVADLATPHGVELALAAAEGNVDILCNHAGVSDRGTFVTEMSDDLWERIFAINLTAPYRLCKGVLPGMLERGHGVIVNTASVTGLRGGRAGSAYTASKWGLVGLTQNIAAHYGSRGIRCNAVCPGPIGPPGSTPARSAGDEAIIARGRPPNQPPEVVASVVLFLASDAARNINGAAIPVDGGWIAF
jgi:NAD(P)-dependent dehydrogenase (short-subunit alcohol dehydrogenase family)